LGLGVPAGASRATEAAIAIARNDVALLPAAESDLAAGQLDTVLNGGVRCPFCGDPLPGGCSKRVWKRTQAREDQLEPKLERRRELEERIQELRDQDIRIPYGCDPHVYIAQIEAGAIPEGHGDAHDQS
jgi:hypothetical protein